MTQHHTVPSSGESLEVVTHPQPENGGHCVGIVCHPNPLHEGTMHNKVVTTIAKAYGKLGFAAVRFNYRGVGNSTGTSIATQEEAVEDCIAVLHWVEDQWPHARVWLAGFSFGAYVAAAVASQHPGKIQQLLTVAPSVERMPFDLLGRVACPWLVIQGDADEVVSVPAVYEWFEQLEADKKLLKFPTTSHFFHGKLIELQTAIVENYDKLS